MKRIFIVLLSCLLSFACSNKLTKSTINKEDNSKERIENLKQSFDRKDYLSFFENFPSSFKELQDFYGYNENAEAGNPLYSCEKHISFLFENCDKIGSEIFMEKIYSIAKGGRWDADAIGLFREGLYNYIMDNPNGFALFLENKSKKETSGLWYFLVDGPIPREDLFKGVYNSIDKRFKTERRFLKDAYLKCYDAYVEADLQIRN